MYLPQGKKERHLLDKGVVSSPKPSCDWDAQIGETPVPRAMCPLYSKLNFKKV